MRCCFAVLPYRRYRFLMKTTLIIDDGLMRRLKALAAQRGESVSALVQTFLLQALDEANGEGRKSAGLQKLPGYKMGEPLVDVADREALERVVDRAGRARR